ncbi:MAG: precorrin-6A reductase [Peptococcaceae bacterium]|nr:precorrin-6A reductase [Peptococcaceae bacterium]
MILVLAGTADGRKMAELIQAEGFSVLVSTATPYGGSLAQTMPVRTGGLDQTGFCALLRERPIKLLVDASHPFAANVSRTAMAACREVGIPYLRYERPSSAIPDSPLIHRVYSYEDAATAVKDLDKCIFLAIGANNLHLFTAVIRPNGPKIIARVLPEPRVIDKCIELGLKPADIVAMQGPFGLELNMSMFRHFKSDVLITKESGQQGGTDAKIAAALACDMQVIVVERPSIDYPTVVKNWAELQECLRSWQNAAQTAGGLN